MIAIRPLDPRDKDLIVELLKTRETFPEHEIKVAIEVIDDALRFPERGDYLVHCAFDGDKLAGYICFGRIPMTDACYDLYWIAVEKRQSRRGIGRRLLEHMEAIARSEGARKIFIETSSLSAFAAARSFYQKNNYEVVSVLSDFYKVGDHKMVFLKNLESIDT